MSVRKRTAREPRGQAVVELALGTLVLITVLVVGIHFAEFGYSWVKLDEAANFALFDETNRQMHTTPGTWDVFDTKDLSSGRLATQVRRRYADFDGLTSSGGSSPLRQVFTRGTAVAVTCQRYKGPDIDVAGAGAVATAAYGKAAQVNAGVRCQVSAELTTYRFPKHFADDANGFFSGKTIDKTMNYPTFCAAGRPDHGSCDGHGFRMVLDDWGFQGEKEGRECELMKQASCSNPGYYQMAEAAYSAAGGSDGNAGSRLAQLVAGASPTSEAPFWMSFRGEEHGFQETHAAELDRTWPTTPLDHPPEYRTVWRGNKECFLGWQC